jgi:hypothetical protein
LGGVINKDYNKMLNQKASPRKQAKNSRKPTPAVSWDLAIRDAEAEIQRLRRRISVLEGGIVVFSQRRDAGDPFPGQADASATGK